jgi:hypothetical protein
VNDKEEQDLTSGPRLVSIAAEFRKRGLPLNPKIYEEIVKNSFASYYYATNYLNPKDTPDELIKSLGKDPNYGMSYAVDVLKGKNVPNVILLEIQKNDIGNYVQKLMAKKYPIPDWYLEYVRMDPDMQVQFYYSWKEALDYRLVDIIPDEAYELISQGAAYKILSLLNDKEIEDFDPKIFKIAKVDPQLRRPRV